MHSNVWLDKNLCGTNLCDQRLTRIICIYKSHAEICHFRVIYILDMHFRGTFLDLTQGRYAALGKYHHQTRASHLTNFTIKELQ